MINWTRVTFTIIACAVAFFAFTVVMMLVNKKLETDEHNILDSISKDPPTLYIRNTDDEYITDTHTEPVIFMYGVVPEGVPCYALKYKQQDNICTGICYEKISSDLILCNSKCENCVVVEEVNGKLKFIPISSP